MNGFKREIKINKIEDHPKYFTAKEAREVSKYAKERVAKNQLDDVYMAINDATFNGKTQITFDKSLLPEVEEFLKTKGFIVHNNDFDLYTGSIISW